MPFLKDHWYAVAQRQELEQAPLVARTVCGEPIVVFRDAGGRARALEDRCSHRMAPLSLGTVVEGTLECGYHGARFDGQGRCVGIPCQPQVREQGLAYYQVRHYPTAERHGLVFVWQGDPERADPALLPDWQAFTGAEMCVIPGYHHVRANYLLILDNLHDLTHLQFVHKATLGKASRGSVWTDYPARVTTPGDTVLTARSMPGLPPSEFSTRILGLSREQRVDRFQRSAFSLPSFVSIQLGVEDGEAGAAPQVSHIVLNAVTPETPTSSHYFWAVARRERVADEDLSVFIHEVTRRAFDEDQAMLEAQQQRISSLPLEQPLLNFSSDKAGEAVRRLIARSLAARGGEAEARA